MDECPSSLGTGGGEKQSHSAIPLKSGKAAEHDFRIENEKTETGKEIERK
jgi:hypothetical protein